MTAAALLRSLHDARISVRVHDGNLLIHPAENLTTDQRAGIKGCKQEIVQCVTDGDALLPELIATAMRACIHFGDGEAMRELMRQDCTDTPAHLRADLREHFRQAYPAP